MGLFKSKPVLTQEHQILDNGIKYPIDSKYADTGLNEGWLEFIHGFRDSRGIYVSTYKHVTKD